MALLTKIPRFEVTTSVVLAITLLTLVPSGSCSWWKVMNLMGLSIPGNAYIEVKCGRKNVHPEMVYIADSSYKFDLDITKFIRKAAEILQEEETPRMASQPRMNPVDQRHQLYLQMGGILKRAGYGAGSACVERVICEVQQYRNTLEKYGLVGELFRLVFTPSLSPYAQTSLLQYLVAESKGHRHECHLWGKKCPFSLFKLQTKIHF